MPKQTWKDPSYFINKIYVEESCLDLEYTREIIRSGKRVLVCCAGQAATKQPGR